MKIEKTEDVKTHDDLAEIAKSKDVLIQELLDEVLALDKLLKFCFDKNKN